MAERYTVADPSPYPELKVTGENKALANRITAAIGGTSGELGTIYGYVYQSVVFSKNYPEYAEVFASLAKAEMHHLKMICTLVDMLGGTPVCGSCRNGQPLYWSGSSVEYTRDLAAALLHDLDSEQKAYADYVSTARQSGDRYVFAVLTRIALDEMIHIGLLKKLIARLRRTNNSDLN